MHDILIPNSNTQYTWHTYFINPLIVIDSYESYVLENCMWNSYVCVFVKRKISSDPIGVEKNIF